jgi:hypothetical protein
VRPSSDWSGDIIHVKLTLREISLTRLVLSEYGRALCDKCMYLDIVSESELAIEMHRTRDMIAEIVKAVTVVSQFVATDTGRSGRSSRKQIVEFGLVILTTTTTYVFDCSSGIAEPCVLVHVHPPLLLCAGAYH